MKCVLLAGLQALHLVGFLAGCPLSDYLAVLVDDLDLRAFKLLAVCYVDLAHLDACDRVFYQ